MLQSIRASHWCLIAALSPALTWPAASQAAQPHTQRVSLVVGNWQAGEGREPKPGGSPLKAPFGVDFDRRGTMFIVELEGGRVHQLLETGSTAVIAGDGSKTYRGDGGPAKDATFNGMHNLAISNKDKLYIADSWNHCIREIDLPSRRIRTIAGNGEAGFAGDGGAATDARFDYVMCITLTPDEDALLIADLRNRRIRRMNLRSQIVETVAGNGEQGAPGDGAQAVDSPLVDPRAVAADSKGQVYVLERGGHALRVVKTDGSIHTVAGTGQRGFRDGRAEQAELGSPKHLCVDDHDRVFIADDVNGAIRCFDPETNSVTTILGRGIGDPGIRLKNPHGVCFEKGKLYVVDMGNDRILRVDFAE